GDYIDVAPAPAFVLTPRGRWVFNTSKATRPTFHVVWTDNRNVSPPRDGNWAHYTPPIYTGPPLDPTQQIPACSPGQTGMRNQNVYTSRITPDLVAGSPGNSNPLSACLRRACQPPVPRSGPPASHRCQARRAQLWHRTRIAPTLRSRTPISPILRSPIRISRTRKL